jgi:hypothetical protein
VQHFAVPENDVICVVACQENGNGAILEAISFLCKITSKHWQCQGMIVSFKTQETCHHLP